MISILANGNGRRCAGRSRALCAGAFLCLCLFGALSCARGDKGDPSPQETPDRPPVELRADVDRPAASTGESITFRITLDADPRASVSLPEVGSRIQGLRIVDMGEEGPKEVEGRLRRERWYRLEADLAGSYVLPDLKVPYLDADGKEGLAETTQIFVEIKPPEAQQGQGEKAADIREIKPLAEIRRPLPLRWILVSAGSLAAAAGFAAWLVRRRKRRQEAEVRMPPEETARRELASLAGSGLLEEGRLREYVFGLSLIFRRYLERKLAIPAAEQTTEEILASLRSADFLGEELRRMARSFLEETDPIKYRGLEPREPETDSWTTGLMGFIERAAALSTGQNMREAA